MRSISTLFTVPKAAKASESNGSVMPCEGLACLRKACVAVGVIGGGVGLCFDGAVGAFEVVGGADGVVFTFADDREAAGPVGGWGVEGAGVEATGAADGTVVLLALGGSPGVVLLSVTFASFC